MKSLPSPPIPPQPIEPFFLLTPYYFSQGGFLKNGKTFWEIRKLEKTPLKSTKTFWDSYLKNWPRKIWDSYRGFLTINSILYSPDECLRGPSEWNPSFKTFIQATSAFGKAEVASSNKAFVLG